MARLALLIAIVALVLSWTAYRRSGGEAATIAKDVVRSAGPAEAHGSGPEPVDDRSLEQVRRQVAELRASLERAYGNATGQTRERWRGIDGDLGRVEAQLKEKSAKGLAELEATLEKLRREAGQDPREKKPEEKK